MHYIGMENDSETFREYEIHLAAVLAVLDGMQHDLDIFRDYLEVARPVHRSAVLYLMTLEIRLRQSAEALEYITALKGVGGPMGFPQKVGIHLFGRAIG